MQNVGTGNVLSRYQVMVPIISGRVFDQKGPYCDFSEIGFTEGKTYTLPPRKLEEELNIDQRA